MKKILLLVAILFCLTGFSQTNSRQKIQSRLNKDLAKLGLSSADVSDWIVESEVSSEGTKITNYYIVQRCQGIEIFNAQSNVSMKDGIVLDIGNNFIKNISKKVNAVAPSLTVQQAIAKAYFHLGIAVPAKFSTVETIAKNSYKLSDGVQEDLISAKLVYQSTKDSKLKLAWAFQFYSPDGKHLWDLRIDALTGAILEKKDLMVRCSFGSKPSRRYPSNYPFSFKLNSIGAKNNPEVSVAAAGSYRVIPYNYESPNHSPFQLIASPSNATASPNGWHNTNTTIGGTTAANIFTNTFGNNVLAQEDADGNDGNGIRAEGTASLVFDFPYGGPTLQPTSYTSAATTNLFYMTNILHDVWYQYGFNEAAGNFQKNNFGKGGDATTSGDYLRADSQDGYSQADPTLNNANFSTPVDGVIPKVQMYMWTEGAPPMNLITVNSPSSIAGPKVASNNDFFGTDKVLVPLAPKGITADVVLYKNNPTPPGYFSACQAPTNAAELKGKIALIKRGSCLFNLKVKNAQKAGAIAVIVMDSIANNPKRLMMNSDAAIGITIPAVFITKELGDSFIAEMAKGALNVKLEMENGLYLYADGDFDNGIIAHEYGHGISTRLTGGRKNSSCLTAPEQMGEGWSDWIALMMQLKAGDNGETPKGLGTYAINQTPTEGGIRSYPYSTNMTINPLTFANTNGKTYIYTDPETLTKTKLVEPHDVGEIWAATLWDLTWAYIGKYGFDSNIYSGTGGNNKVMQLVIDAMKIQPCNPSFIQARDAIIAADKATGGKEYCMIWKVFARRGLGVKASSGKNSGDSSNIAAINDQVEDFTEPAPSATCTLTVNKYVNSDKISIYPNPAPKGQFFIHTNDFAGNLNIRVVDLNGRIVFTQDNVDFNSSVEKSFNLNQLQKGIYIIKVGNQEIDYTEKLFIN